MRFPLWSLVFCLPACGGGDTPQKPSTPPPAANAPAANSPAVQAPAVQATPEKAPAANATPAVTPAPGLPAAIAPAAASATPANPADLGKVLEAITDGPTAQAAKDKLDSILQQLKTAKAAVSSGQLGGDLGKLAGAAAAKAGVDFAALKAAAGKQLDSLLQNQAVKGAIGPTLEQIKSLLQ